MIERSTETSPGLSDAWSFWRAIEGGELERAERFLQKLKAGQSTLDETTSVLLDGVINSLRSRAVEKQKKHAQLKGVRVPTLRAQTVRPASMIRPVPQSKPVGEHIAAKVREGAIRAEWALDSKLRKRVMGQIGRGTGFAEISNKLGITRFSLYDFVYLWSNDSSLSPAERLLTILKEIENSGMSDRGDAGTDEVEEILRIKIRQSVTANWARDAKVRAAILAALKKGKPAAGIERESSLGLNVLTALGKYWSSNFFDGRVSNREAIVKVLEILDENYRGER